MDLFMADTEVIGTNGVRPGVDEWYTARASASRLETERLLLRPMLETDFGALHLIFSDAKVMAAFDHPPFTRKQMMRWLGRNLNHQQEFGYGLFSVILKETGELIGDCGLEQMQDMGAAELGYDFRSDFWNQGYATEAALAVRDYAFHDLHLPQLISLIRVGNLASKRVAEKVGMTLAEEFTRNEIRYWRYSMKNLKGMDHELKPAVLR
jgi:[ribosomal protein S5]-alanine N-acetyltransferase